MAAVGGDDVNGTNATLYIVSPINGQTTREIRLEHGGIYSLEFSPDSSRLSAAMGDGTVLLFDTDNFNIYREIDLGPRVYSAAFSPDGSAVLAGDSSGKLHIYWPYNGTQSCIQAHSDRIFNTLWFDNDSLLSCGEDGLVKRFDGNMNEMEILSAHNDTVICLSASPGGRYLISGGWDGKLVLWDTMDFSVLYELGNITYDIYCNAMSPDGSHACYGTSDSRIIVIFMDPDEDGVLLEEDIFPDDPAASIDTDGDGYPDEWNEGMDEEDSTSELHIDSFPTDPAASLDSDGDGYPDEWNEGTNVTDPVTNPGRLDDFPWDPAASLDSDGDGYPDEWNEGMGRKNSTTGLKLDEFPDDPDEWADEDWPFGDGIGDNGDWMPGLNNYFFIINIIILVLIVAIIAVIKIRKRNRSGIFPRVSISKDDDKIELKGISVHARKMSDYEAVEGKTAEIIPNYFITHKIGSGGFATVYAAKGLEIPRVALKLPKLLDETLDSGTYEKFEAESRIWKKLKHRNIVEVHDTGIEPVPYIAMELMEGGNLKQLLLDRALSVEESIDIMLGLLDAISFAHRMATVHRDIKPENILFSSEGRPMITDWGIGKFMASDSITKSTGSKGTLAYSAPEQVSREKFGDVDWSTDMFQMGIVFYEMLTGKNPFSAEDPAAVIANIIYREVPPPSSINPKVSEALDHIVMRALKKHKRARWRSTDVMYDRLKELVNRHS